MHVKMMCSVFLHDTVASETLMCKCLLYTILCKVTSLVSSILERCPLEKDQ